MSKEIVKPICRIDPSAIISDKAIFIGPNSITIAANSVIHPYARLDSTYGPIDVHEYCIISERAAIGPADHPISLDSHTMVDIGAEVMARSIGKASVIGAQAKIDKNAQIGKFCKICPKSIVSEDENIQDFTILASNTVKRNDTTTAKRQDIQNIKLRGQEVHVASLRKLIPTSLAKWQ